jgi:hypothetical protein
MAGFVHFLVVDFFGTFEIEELFIFARVLDGHAEHPVLVVSAECETVGFAIDDKLDETVTIVGEVVESGMEVFLALEDKLTLSIVDGRVADIAVLGVVIAHIHHGIAVTINLEGYLVAILLGTESEHRQGEKQY